jgi:hypothetical protein
MKQLIRQNNELILLGGLDSVIYICIPILISYYSKIEYTKYHLHYPFTKFLWVTFGFVIVRTIYLMIGAWVLLKLTKKKVTPTDVS